MPDIGRYLAVVSNGLAIRLRGVVKRYGEITAVDGLDLDVPEGTCVGLLGPNGAGKSTTMKMLTAQAIADEGELEVLGLRAARRLQGGARARWASCPQLDNLDVTLTVEQNLLVFAHLYRDRRAPSAAPRSSGRCELANLRDRRDTRVDKLSGGMRRRLLIARALVHRPRLRAARRADRRPGPAGAPGAVGADRPRCAAEGTSILMSTHYIEEAQRLADTVTIMSPRQRGRASGRPPSSWPSTPAREAVEVYGPPARLRRGRGRRARAGAAHAAHGHRASRCSATATASTASAGRPTSRTSSCCSPGRRSRDDRRVALERRLGRLERSALTGVLVREVVNFSSFWKSTTFSSTVEPTIYLIAFGFGFGSLVSTVDGYDYVEFVATGTVATGVLFASVFPAMFGTFVKFQFQRTYDAILAAPVDTEELVTAEALWIAARAGGVRQRAAAGGAWSSAWTPRGACSPCPSSASWPASAGVRAGS